VQIGLQTTMGQMLDLITTHTGAKDLARYRIQGYLTGQFDKFV
jgi:farnesyl diphosphate synthase